MLIQLLSEVKDNRRKQGRRYELVPVIFFAIAAVLAAQIPTGKFTVS